MSKKQPANISASVRQRLLNHATKTDQDFQVVLAQYGFERLLYRLSQSAYSDQFTLKGALMFLVWMGEQYRPTRDMDLMSRQMRTADELREVFRALCVEKVDDDGLALLADTVEAERIRDEDDYGGMRVTLSGKLGQARIPLQIDIGFGDAITPRATRQDFPVLLDFAAPSIAMYPPETTIAEKFQTIVVRGMLNSRMKDYYDIWALCRERPFDGAVLTKAIAATFRRRKTRLPSDTPMGLSDDFALDASKRTQWAAFVRRTPLRLVEKDLAVVVSDIRGFLDHPSLAAASGSEFALVWQQKGPRESGGPLPSAWQAPPDFRRPYSQP